MQQEQCPTREEVYDTVLDPLMKELLKLCREHDIPFVCSMQINEAEEDAMLCTSANTPVWCSDHLMDALNAIYPPREAFLSVITRAE